MSNKHYELGVSLYKRRSILGSPVRLLTLVVVVAGVSAFGAATYDGRLPGISNSSRAEVARRSNKVQSQKKATQLSTREARISRRAARLQVRPADVVVPSATPSTPVISNPAPAGESAPPLSPPVTTEPALPVIAPVAPPVVPPAPIVDETPAAPIVPPPAIPVIDQLPNPITVVTPPELPPIVLSPIVTPDASAQGLADPTKKDIAMQLVSSAENSSLDWKAQYGYIEDIGDGRGYTAGIIGFCSGTHDMLELVRYYAELKPGNVLVKYTPALVRVDGTASHAGLGAAFVADWKTAANDPVFQQAQNQERDRAYFDPAVGQAKSDGLRTLGQFIYYDAMVMHGPGNDPASFGGIRAAAMKRAKTPAQLGQAGLSGITTAETAYLHAFLDARRAAMKAEAAHDDTSRIDTAQRLFLQAGNLDLQTPLIWKVYGDPFNIR